MALGSTEYNCHQSAYWLVYLHSLAGGIARHCVVLFYLLGGDTAMPGKLHARLLSRISCLKIFNNHNSNTKRFKEINNKVK